MNKLLLTLLIPTLSMAAMSPRDMMAKNEEMRKVSEFEASAVLTTGEKAGTPKVKDFTIYRKVQQDKIHNSTLTRFHAPAEVRGEGILIIENNSGKNDVLLYLPSFKKIRRVESQQQSGSFMGSVFSYSDIATPHVDDYTYKTLAVEKCQGDAKLQCSKIECIPSNEEVKDRTGYSKSVVWVRPDNFMVEHAEYYNLEGKLFKVMKATEIKEVDTKNHKWLAHNLNVVNQLTGEYTSLIFSKVKVNSGISDAMFTQQNLSKVK